jgi:hypothetical protein
MTSQCCNSDNDIFGACDVRGMCFTCIGDMSQMTADDILRVRQCKNTPWALAWWIWNNHNDEFVKMMKTGNFGFITNNKYMCLLLTGFGKNDACISEVIKQLEELNEE